MTVLDVGKLKFGYTATPAIRRASPTWPVPGAEPRLQREPVRHRCTDFAVFRTERRQGNIYDITRNAWGADFPHPDNQLRDLFATGAGNNNSGYANPAFDLLLSQASVEQDPAKAHELYVRAQRLLVDDAPVLWLNTPSTATWPSRTSAASPPPRPTVRTSATCSRRISRSCSTDPSTGRITSSVPDRLRPVRNLAIWQPVAERDEPWAATSSVACCG